MIVKKTYEDFMNNYLWKLPSDMDTREGTLAHLVMSVTAMSMAELYEELALVEENAYAITATGEYLDRSVDIIGLKRLGKIKAIVKIEGDEGLFVGDTLTGGEFTYTVTEVNDGYYLAECNTAGTEGNSYIGEVLPEKDGVEIKADIVSIVVAGCDEEDDESLRKRYLERIHCPVCMGNVSYYKNAINSLIGVGGIKIVPVHEGLGTVKVIITDSEYNVASDDLKAYVKNYLDPEETSGLGYGVVPIGHRVTVESVESVDVYIDVEINGSSSNEAYLRYARALLKVKLQELNKNWDGQDNIVIWNRMIEDAVFSINGVKDVKVNSINREISRLILGENQIVGEVYVNES